MKSTCTEIANVIGKLIAIELNMHNFNRLLLVVPKINCTNASNDVHKSAYIILNTTRLHTHTLTHTQFNPNVNKL